MNYTEARKELPIYQIRNKLISEIQKNSCLVLLGKSSLH
jgi:HrpA-like RNA helicase